MIDVAIIGAGPAGLNLAHRLTASRLRTRLLERGEGAGDSWRRMPRDMRLNSPVGASVLGDTKVGFLEWDRIWNRGRFYTHIRDFTERHALEVEAGVDVSRVAALPSGGFRIESSQGELESRVVVNATGYFNRPFVPFRPGLETAKLLQMTVPEYGSPDAVRDRLGGRSGRILIVGARITAGQLGVELHDAGFDVTISHRTPIEFGFAPAVQRLGFRAYYPYETWRLRDPEFAARDSGHPMQGGRAKELIEGGRIATRPDVESVDDHTVHFVGGGHADFDAVLWATGYRPALDHLAGLVDRDPESGLPAMREMESVDAPGLFFLGLDQQTDFTSRMLRGIRRDAALLADRLIARFGPGAG
ncbi:MAG: NAD(P)-binding domain-containing protein [Myxococcota bacterium]